MTTKHETILIARDSGVVEIKGESFTVTRAVTRIRADHPLAKAAPHLFTELDVHYDVEQATAAPGEKRAR